MAWCIFIGAVTGGVGGSVYGFVSVIRNRASMPWGRRILLALFAELILGVVGGVGGFIVGAVTGALIAICIEIGSPNAVFLLGFLAIIVLALIRATWQQKREENLDFVYDERAVALKADKTERLLEFLAKQDGTMDPKALRNAVSATFLQLQQCWQKRDLAPMKPLQMNSLYNQQCAQIQGMIRDHEINVIEGVQIERLDLVNLRYTHKPDLREFTALITARARDYYVDDRTQAFLRGDQAPATFQEFWTFQRQGDSWLLRQIEQSGESDVLKDENFVEMFTDRQLQGIYGPENSPGGPAGPWLEKSVETKANRIDRMLNFLVETDKMWNRDLILERARQVFLNVLLARGAGDPSAIKTDELFPDVAADLRAEIERNRLAGRSIEYRNLCVRKVELILLRNFSDNNEDEFTVRITAHAQQIIKKYALVTMQDEDVMPFEQYWVFGRLDWQWKLKEVLPPAAGRKRVALENVDQDVDASTLQWYYTKSRTG